MIPPSRFTDTSFPLHARFRSMLAQRRPTVTWRYVPIRSHGVTTGDRAPARRWRKWRHRTRFRDHLHPQRARRAEPAGRPGGVPGRWGPSPLPLSGEPEQAPSTAHVQTREPSRAVVGRSEPSPSSKEVGSTRGPAPGPGTSKTYWVRCRCSETSRSTWPIPDPCRPPSACTPTPSDGMSTCWSDRAPRGADGSSEQWPSEARSRLRCRHPTPPPDQGDGSHLVG